LYVPPAHRRAGVGAALLEHLAGVTVARGCARLEWAALDWNEPALNLYERIGAHRLDDWIVHRLDGAGLRASPAGRDRLPEAFAAVAAVALSAGMSLAGPSLSRAAQP
jgi:hypothetical protein